MAPQTRKDTSARLLSDPLARVLVPENVYAATFLLDRICCVRESAQVVPLMETAYREIQNGDVSEQTLDWLITLQPTR